ncbi:iron ABC transporter permease [Eubacteriales bacterium OttesenSCG-928-M02]|nr:iron ABC transporter permease [Eubacteriales bacterium OttesenSCG-928-M02]
MIDKKSYTRLVLLLSAALVLFVLIALCVGRFSVNPKDVFAAIKGKITGVTVDEAMENVVFYIRIPRIIAALLIGAGLSISGAVYQSTFRNPLISPDLLGVSSGASTGAAMAIMLGAGLNAMQGFAFVGGILAVMMATALPRLFRNRSNMMLVLSGIIVSGFMSSLLGIIKFFAEDRTDLATIVFWQMGSIATMKVEQVLSILPVMLGCLCVVFLLAWWLNLLSFGEEEARSVGANVKRLRAIAIVCASLLTASAVSVSGTVGWIGLVIPHLGRLLCGADNTKLLPVTALLGGGFLLVLDTLARSLTTMEIPLSILTGLFGAPFYAWLLYKQRSRVS